MPNSQITQSRLRWSHTLAVANNKRGYLRSSLTSTVLVVISGLMFLLGLTPSIASPAAQSEVAPQPAATATTTEATETAPPSSPAPADNPAADTPDSAVNATADGPNPTPDAVAAPATEGDAAGSDAAPAAESDATESDAAPAAGNETAASPSPAPSASATPAELDVLNPLDERIEAPKTAESEATEKRSAASKVLNSSDPKDYQRTKGIWISDSDNGRIIYMKDLEGNDFYTVGISGHGMGRFLRPEQIWVDIEGKIYVADRGNNRIIRMDDIRGVGWTEMTGFAEPRGVAAHGKRLFVADTGANRILVYDKFGASEPMATLTDAKLKSPGYLWLDMEGNLYVCCGEYPPGGSIVCIPYNLTTPASEWTVYKGNGLEGNKFAPTHMLQNDDGIFIVDGVSQRLVRVNNMRGANSWELGSYGRGSHQFLDPQGISQDEEGNIYIADTGNDRIVRIKNIRGQEWTTYDTFETTFGLRAPRSVYVWSPRPAKEEEDADGEGKDDGDKKDGEKKDDSKGDSSK